MDGNQNKILELLAPDLQTKSYAKDQRESGEERQKRERDDRERGRGGLVDDLRQTHRAKPKPKLDSMSRSVNIKCRRRCAIEI